MTTVEIIRDAVENYCGHEWPDSNPLPEFCPECHKIAQAVFDRIQSSTTKAEGGIPADGLGVAREVKATIALDGDTRRCCNNPDCDNDWPCALHPEHPQPSVQGPSEREAGWRRVFKKHMDTLETEIGAMKYSLDSALRANSPSPSITGRAAALVRKLHIIHKGGGYQSVWTVAHMLSAPSITSERIAEIVGDILEPITAYDVTCVIEKALREAGVRVGE